MAEPLRAITVPGSQLTDDLLLYTARDFIGVEQHTADERARRGINALMGWSRTHYAVHTRQHNRQGKHRTHLLAWAAIVLEHSMTGTAPRIHHYNVSDDSLIDEVQYKMDRTRATASGHGTGSAIVTLATPMPHDRFRVVPLSYVSLMAAPITTGSLLSRTQISVQRSGPGPMAFAIVGVP